MYKSTFDRIGYQIEALQIDCDKQEVYYKTMITTHEVTIGQQEIRIKKLEEQIGQQTIQLQRQEEKLGKAQEVVEDNVQTILRLQMELRTADAEVDSLLEQNEILYSLVPDGAIEVSGEYPNTSSSGRGMIEYPFNPEGEKEPYPYTHPIREIPDYSRVKVK